MGQQNKALDEVVKRIAGSRVAWAMKDYGACPNDGRKCSDCDDKIISMGVVNTDLTARLSIGGAMKDITLRKLGGHQLYTEEGMPSCWHAGNGTSYALIISQERKPERTVTNTFRGDAVRGLYELIHKMAINAKHRDK